MGQRDRNELKVKYVKCTIKASNKNMEVCEGAL